MRRRKHGIPVSESDIVRVFYRYRQLHPLSVPELTRGIAERPVGGFPYLVTVDSVFYPYFKALGKKEIYFLS